MGITYYLLGSGGFDAARTGRLDTYRLAAMLINGGPQALIDKALTSSSSIGAVPHLWKSVGGPTNPRTDYGYCKHARERRLAGDLTASSLMSPEVVTFVKKINVFAMENNAMVKMSEGNVEQLLTNGEMTGEKLSLLIKASTTYILQDQADKTHV